ncbi:class I glutamine amidotransferase-like protein [Thelonectria olida]|uniref:Class I glutamine amidotransferase-like protein n=1 Tax=Thelonectria olida TaxID=1576542 RepID=A0A9P8WE00_9HYPO|nr:class I glutamine amidotransferase-like protein [Thelonectria olida]
MSAHKSSAVADQEPLDVLVAVHEKFDLLDFSGAVEVFNTAVHDLNDPENSKAFEITIVGPEPKVLSSQGVIIGSQISYKEAHDRLEDFDLLVVVGGNSKEVIEKELEPLSLISDFAELQKRDPARERTVLSICTGALFLGKQGILSGLSATTHSDYLTTFENICSDAATLLLQERTDVIEDARYVVNNLRFDLGDEDENPYIHYKTESGRRPSLNARKGSMSFKGSISRRESIVRRAAMRLGGLRVVTAGGVSCGIDAALYLVSAMVDDACALEVARTLQWTWNKGVVVDGLDV